jgi:23S rRNA pseudouridine1911/1915/1917 synthase
VRLDLALKRLHPDLSRRKARDVIEKGQVELEGKVALEPGLLVPDGARISWDPNRKARRRTRCSLPLLYQDEALVIVDKPAGLLSVPTGPGVEGEDTALLRVQDFARHFHPTNPYVGVVHRIDRGTSGALAFALNAAAREALRTLFREHRIERVYQALVRGEPAAPEGRIDRPIHDSFVGGRRRVARSGEPSHPATTRYRVVERLPSTALLEVQLETGRQHQIRVHLASIGLPILGDFVYGPGGEDVPRPMLHARLLGFPHPLSGERILVESPLPPDFAAVLRRLRGLRPGPGLSALLGAPGVDPQRGRPPGRTGPRGGTRSRPRAPRPTSSSNRPSTASRRARKPEGRS